MEADKYTDGVTSSDDIMLSSAEDLNNDGSFMGGRDMPAGREARQEEELGKVVADLTATEEFDDEEIEPEEPSVDVAPERPHYHDYHAERRDMREERKGTPIVVIPKNEDSEKHYEEDRRPMFYEGRKKECAEPRERTVHSAPAPKAQIVSAESYKGINKIALIWMIILTVILGGVIGIMLYAFILNRIEANKGPEPEPDSSLQEGLSAVAGALEVYLTEVNLSNYNTDIVLVNGGGTVSITGTLKHTVFINSTSALTLVLNGVTVESENNAAVINLSKNDLVIRADGMNTIRGDGGKYNAALYSNGKMTIKGDGQIMIYASGAEGKAISTKNGYQVNGAAIVGLGQTGTERPLDESTQAYFTKDLSQLYQVGTVVSADDEAGSQVVRFVAPGSFSSIFVSNSRLEDGVQYSISLGSRGVK